MGVQTYAQSVGEVQQQLAHHSSVVRWFLTDSVVNVRWDGSDVLGGYCGAVFYWDLFLLTSHGQRRQIKRVALALRIRQQIVGEDATMPTGRLLVAKLAGVTFPNHRIHAEP